MDSDTVKIEHAVDDNPPLISKAKGKSHARMTTPIEVSSDDDVNDTPQAAQYVA